MPRQIGESAFFDTPDDIAKREQAKLDAEAKLKPSDHQYLEVVNNGMRYSVSLKDFMDKYGNPTQYSQADLYKYVMQTWMKKNLGE